MREEMRWCNAGKEKGGAWGKKNRTASTIITEKGLGRRKRIEDLRLLNVQS